MTADTDDNNTVIIIGAGLAGLSLALGLVHHDETLKVDIIERSFDFSRTGATFGLAPNGRKALDDLYPGIAQELVDIGVHMKNLSGGTMLGWWNVRDALLKRVQDNEKERITIHSGCLVKEIFEEESGVTILYQARVPKEATATQGPLHKINGFVLVGADGVNSSIRSHLGLAKAKTLNVMLWRSRLTIDTSVQGKVEAEDVLRPLLDIPIVPFGVRMRGAMNYVLFNFHPKLDGTMALVINYQGDDVDEIQPGSTPDAIMEKYVKEHFAKEGDPQQCCAKELKEVQAIVQLVNQDGLTHPVRMKVIELPPEDGNGWGGRGRITVTGDAAHGMRPASGQGGSMAFEDSVILCRVIKKLRDAKPNPSTSEVETALKDFENQRLARIRLLWIDQWDRSEATYKNVEMEPWSPEFKKFVFDGV